MAKLTAEMARVCVCVFEGETVGSASGTCLLKHTHTQMHKDMPGINQERPPAADTEETCTFHPSLSSKRHTHTPHVEHMQIHTHAKHIKLSHSHTHTHNLFHISEGRAVSHSREKIMSQALQVSKS